MTSYAIRAKGITKHFGDFTALNNVSFDLEKGEVHCLAGENGCGKSTLIKVLNGAHKPDQGAQFIFENEHLSEMTPAEAKARGIHVIWQDLALFPDLSVAENINFDQFVKRPFKGKDSSLSIKRAEAVFKDLGIDIDPSVRLGDLSIAKRQLVAISRVLLADAKIVFMDEPTASLTKKETDALLRIVRGMAEKGISIVFVSHRLAEVLDICKRVTVIKDGQLVGTFSAEGMTQKKLSHLMTGKDLSSTQRPPQHFEKNILELKNLNRNGEYSDVNLVVHSGEILGLTGLMGSGRTELAQSIFGLTSPDSGQIILEGKPIYFKNNREAIKHGIAYVSEDRLNLGLDQSQSISKNSAATVISEISSKRFFLNPKAIKELADHWIKKLHTKVQNSALPVSSLSGGNQQRIVLAKWLATQPKVLILDSPTVGVDVGAKAGIFEIVRNLADDGMAIILISDEASEIHAHSDRALVLRDGSVIQELDPRLKTEQEIEGIINA